MADFVTAFNYAMSNEDPTLSGIVITDSDGGQTRLGLDSKSNPELLKIRFYDEPLEQALVIAKYTYRYKYWDVIKGDDINDQRIASKFFDMAVNEGTEEAIKLMQRSAYGVPNGPDIDGKMGPMTINAINNASSNVISLLLNIVS